MVSEEHIVAYINNELDQVEKEEFEKWLLETEENKQYFDQICDLWERLDREPNILDSDAAMAWKKINPDNQKYRLLKRIKERRNVLLRYAAAAVIVLGLGYLTHYLVQGKDPRWISVNSGNEKQEITLSDGSSVFLNAHSSILYPENFKGKNRFVQFDGEAYFSVSKDKHHPFLIQMGNSQVKVLGTSFNIKRVRYSKQISVVVDEGLVSFGDMKDTKNNILIAAGEEGVYIPGINQFQKQKISNPNYLAWKSGILIFKGTKLKEVFDTIGEYYNTQFIIGDEELNGLTLSTEFNNKTLSEVIQVLEITFDITITFNGSCYQIKKQ